jgi:hypothetical protein
MLTFASAIRRKRAKSCEVRVGTLAPSNSPRGIRPAYGIVWRSGDLSPLAQELLPTPTISQIPVVPTARARNRFSCISTEAEAPWSPLRPNDRFAPKAAIQNHLFQDRRAHDGPSPTDDAPSCLPFLTELMTIIPPLATGIRVNARFVMQTMS